MTKRSIGKRPAPDTASAEPQPWLTEEDAHGWRIRYRGGGRAHEVKTTVVVELDASQAAWVRREAARSGLSYAGIIKRLVDVASAAEAPADTPDTHPTS